MRARLLAAARRPAVQALFLVVALALILLLRRGDTLLVPGVWDEDGDMVIPDMLQNGLGTLLHPLNGYFVTIPKIIDLIAFGLSATQFPLINAALAWLVAIGVGLAVAFAPTVLRHRGLAALAVFLVPSDPEVFGTGLYTLWWAGILLLLVALWRPDDRRILARVLLLAIAGLSSPVILIAAPVLVVRALVWRRRSEIVPAAVGLTIAIVQGISLVVSTLTGTSNSPGSSGAGFAPTMLGEYLAHSWTSSSRIRIAAGILLVIFLVVGALLLRSGPRWPAIVLGYLLAASVILSLARTAGLALDPVTLGPRYFFYPFVLISWFLLWLVARWRWRGLVALPVALLLLGLANLPPGWSRPNADLHWAQQLRACAAADGPVRLSIQAAGSADHVWHVTLHGADCASWLARDPFRG